MAKVAGYIRVSTKEQEEERSHERQKEYLKNWAENEGHEIEFFEDIAVSGQNNDRPNYEKMKEQAHHYDLIVVRELSRLGRSLREVLNDLHYLTNEVGTPVIMLKDNIDLSTAQGKLLFHIMAAINQFWADLAREATLELIEKRRKEGKFVGRPPKTSIAERKKAKEWHDKGLSYTDIGRLLNVHRATAKKYVEEFE